MNLLRSILILGRVSNLPTVWTNVILGWLLGRQLIGLEVGWLVLGVSLLYWAGMTLNDAFDAKWDAKYAPERPIPSGQVSRTTAWILGVVQMVLGVGVVLLKTNAHWEILSALVVAILLYDVVHKKWQGSVYIMGACRVLVYFLAYSAARDGYFFQSNSYLIYAVCGALFIYIAALTYVARRERSSDMGESKASVLLLLPAFIPFSVRVFERFIIFNQYLIGVCIAACAVWIIKVLNLLNAGRIPQAISYAIAGIALYDGALALLLEFKAGLICLGCFLLTLILQRFIPAT